MAGRGREARPSAPSRVASTALSTRRSRAGEGEGEREGDPPPSTGARRAPASAPAIFVGEGDVRDDDA